MNKSKLILIPLSILIFTGAILRLYKLTNIPAGFLQDEAAAGYDAYCLLKIGLNVFSVRFTVAFLSVLSIPLVFLLRKELRVEIRSYLLL